MERPTILNLRVCASGQSTHRKAGPIPTKKGPQGLSIVLAVASLARVIGARQDRAARFRDEQTGLAEVRALDRAGKRDQAVVQWSLLLRQFPGMPDAQLGLANDLALVDRCEAAAPGPSDSPTGSARGEQEAVAGICYYRRNDLRAAIKHLEATVKQAPDDRQPAIFLGRAYASSGRPEEGIRA